MEDGISLTESVNRALRVMQFTIHTGLKLTPFELYHGRKPRTELTNTVKTENHTYLIGQNCLFQQQPDQKFPYMWAVMRTGHHKPYYYGKNKNRGVTRRRWTEVTEEEKFC